MKLEKIVGAICASCSFSCFKDGCPRGEWAGVSSVFAPLSQAGADKACPLLSFPAKKPKGSSPSVAVTDTWKVCSECQYSNGQEIPMENYLAHCLDCMCASARERLEETAAEAAIS